MSCPTCSKHRKKKKKHAAFWASGFAHFCPCASCLVCLGCPWQRMCHVIFCFHVLPYPRSFHIMRDTEDFLSHWLVISPTLFNVFREGKGHLWLKTVWLDGRGFYIVIIGLLQSKSFCRILICESPLVNLPGRDMYPKRSDYFPLRRHFALLLLVPITSNDRCPVMSV